MNADIEARSIAALEALEQGEPIESILRRYPEDADLLRPLLETVSDLQTLPLAYSVSAKRSSQEAMLREARRLHSWPATGSAVLPLLRRFAFAFAAVVLLFLAGAGLLARPVSGALPGEALYPLKRASENLRLTFAADPTVLEASYRQQRRDELLQLLGQGQEAEVECFGTIMALEEEQWQLDDLTLLIDAESVITGQPAIGAPVEGSCLARDGLLFARNIRIAGPGIPLPEPPTPTPTRERPTETPTPSPTPTTTLTTTPTATPTLELPAAVATPSAPLPTPADDDDDEDDDDGGDGDEDNGDDVDDDDNRGSDVDDDDGDGDSDGDGDDGDDDNERDDRD